MKFLIMVLTTACLVLGSFSGLSGQRKRTTRSSTTTASKAPSRASGSLSIEAGLVFKSGDVKPVARTTFHLVDDDLESILESAGLKPMEGLSLVSTYAFAVRYKQLEKYDEFNMKAREAITSHIKATMVTDFTGKGEFAALPAGIYYVVGFSLVNNQAVVWDTKVDLKPGKNSLSLDQNNAAQVL